MPWAGPASPAASVCSEVAATIGRTADGSEAIRRSLEIIVRELGCAGAVVWSVDAADVTRRVRVAATPDGAAAPDGELSALRLPVGGQDVGVLELVAPPARSARELEEMLAPALVQLGQAVERVGREPSRHEAALVQRTAELERLSAELETTATLLEERHAALEESHEEIERANVELEAAERIQAALRRVAEAVAEERELDELAPLAAREVARVAGAAGAAVLKISEGEGEGEGEGVGEGEGEGVGVVVGAWARPGLPAPAEGVSIDLGARLPPAVAVRTGRPAGFDDVAMAGVRPLWDSASFAGAMAVPVYAESEPWGALVVAARRGETLEEAVEGRLLRIAELVGMAVANADARERVLADAVADMLGGEWDRERTLQSVVEAARRALRAERASCYVHSEDGLRIEQAFTTEADPQVRRFLESAVGKTRDQLPIWSGLLGSSQPLLVVSDVRADRTIPSAMREALGSGAFIGIRLEHASVGTRDGSGLVGSLFLSFSQPRRFRRRQREVARSLGSVAAMAIANARLHAATLRSLAEAERRASTDHLTGLANHRSFQEALLAGYGEAVRAGWPMSVTVFDIDDFKNVNARFGHAIGDDVLREVAARLGASLGPGGVLGRVGGEEFAWLTHEDPEAAWERVALARTAVAARPIPDASTVTVSAGFADLRHARDADELLRFAQGALYWAKTHGRDTAFRYSREVVEFLSPDEQAGRLQRSQSLQSMRVLARAVDAKDPSTAQHSERVADLASALATALGWDHVQTSRLREAGLVHDVGKISVPDAILFKPDAISAGEYERLRAHAAIGAQMVEGVLDADQVAWIRGHHERWDGSGYPDGLAGDAIPEGARLIAMADAWDVMTSDRPYRRAMSREAALDEVDRSGGTQFWPDAVAALRRIVAAGALPVDIAPPPPDGDARASPLRSSSAGGIGRSPGADPPGP